MALNKRTAEAVKYYIGFAKAGWSMFDKSGNSMNIPDNDQSDDLEPSTDDVDGVLFNSNTNMGYAEDTLRKDFGIDYAKFTRGQLAYRVTHNNQDYSE